MLPSHIPPQLELRIEKQERRKNLELAFGDVNVSDYARVRLDAIDERSMLLLGGLLMLLYT